MDVDIEAGAVVLTGVICPIEERVRWVDARREVTAGIGRGTGQPLRDDGEVVQEAW